MKEEWRSIVGYEKCIADNALYYASFEHNDWLLGKGDSLFDSILLAIEWLIDHEYFNKEYLV